VIGKGGIAVLSWVTLALLFGGMYSLLRRKNSIISMLGGRMMTAPKIYGNCCQIMYMFLRALTIIK